MLRCVSEAMLRATLSIACFSHPTCSDLRGATVIVCVDDTPLITLLCVNRRLEFVVRLLSPFAETRYFRCASGRRRPIS